MASLRGTSLKGKRGGNRSVARSNTETEVIRLRPNTGARETNYQQYWTFAPQGVMPELLSGNVGSCYFRSVSVFGRESEQYLEDVQTNLNQVVDAEALWGEFKNELLERGDLNEKTRSVLENSSSFYDYAVRTGAISSVGDGWSIIQQGLLNRLEEDRSLGLVNTNTPIFAYSGGKDYEPIKKAINECASLDEFLKTEVMIKVYYGRDGGEVIYDALRDYRVFASDYDGMPIFVKSVINSQFAIQYAMSKGKELGSVDFQGSKQAQIDTQMFVEQAMLGSAAFPFLGAYFKDNPTQSYLQNFCNAYREWQKRGCPKDKFSGASHFSFAAANKAMVSGIDNARSSIITDNEFVGDTYFCMATTESVSQGVGVTAGGCAGGWAGAKVGAVIGAWGGPVGAFLGMAVGGVVGGVVGAYVGSEVAGFSYKRLMDPEFAKEMASKRKDPSYRKACLQHSFEISYLKRQSEQLTKKLESFSPEALRYAERQLTSFNTNKAKTINNGFLELVFPDPTVDDPQKRVQLKISMTPTADGKYETIVYNSDMTVKEKVYYTEEQLSVAYDFSKMCEYQQVAYETARLQLIVNNAELYEKASRASHGVNPNVERTDERQGDRVSVQHSGDGAYAPSSHATQAIRGERITENTDPSHPYPQNIGSRVGMG